MSRPLFPGHKQGLYGLSDWAWRKIYDILNANRDYHRSQEEYALHWAAVEAVLEADTLLKRAAK